jgi:hypothetical protein
MIRLQLLPYQLPVTSYPLDACLGIETQADTLIWTVDVTEVTQLPERNGHALLDFLSPNGKCMCVGICRCSWLNKQLKMVVKDVSGSRQRKRLAQHHNSKIEDGVPVLQDQTLKGFDIEGWHLKSSPKDLDYMAQF